VVAALALAAISSFYEYALLAGLLARPPSGDVAYGRRRVVVRHRTDHPKGVRSKSRFERIVDLRRDASPGDASAPPSRV
jgi:hypothetical protein